MMPPSKQMGTHCPQTIRRTFDRNQYAPVFDDVRYREELIAAGVLPANATALVARMARARRDGLDQVSYRSRLIESGTGIDGATQLATVARRLHAAPEPQEESANRLVTFGDALDIANPAAAVATGQLNRSGVVPSGNYRGRSTTTTQAGRSAVATKEFKLINAGAMIASDRPSGEDMAFTHAVLCQVGLPRAKFAGREFMRRSGAAWVSVQAGWLDEGNGPVEQPIPYGVMPRLALAWVSTYAKRNSTREIPVGNSAAEFLRLLDMASEGRRYLTLRKQMHALAACRLQLGFRGCTFNGQPVQQFDAWVSSKADGQRPLWPGVMTLSEHYFNQLQDSAVPLDLRAIHALKGSALALDVYAWLAHRLHRIDGRPVILHWKSLREQFGQEYQGKDPGKDFKKQFLLVMRNVQAVYPQAKIKTVSGGLMLMASPPPVQKKS